MVSQVSDRLTSHVTQLYRQNTPYLSRYGSWFLMAWLAALADGKLFIAVTAGALAYRFVAVGYRVDLEPLNRLCDRLRYQIVQMSYTPLGASILAFGGTYGCVAAWSELGANWAATTFVGLGVMNILLWSHTPASRSIPTREASEPLPSDPRAHHWRNLAAADSLQRLMAVRELLHWNLSSAEGTETYLPGTTVTVRSHLIDCFRVMLTHESEPLVRVALIEGLKALQPKPQLSAGQPAMKPMASRVCQVEMQRSVEYVEP